MHGNLNAEAETGSMPVDIQSTEHSFQTQGVSHHFAEKLNYSLSSLKKIKKKIKGIEHILSHTSYICPSSQHTETSNFTAARLLWVT